MAAESAVPAPAIPARAGWRSVLGPSLSPPPSPANGTWLLLIPALLLVGLLMLLPTLWLVRLSLFDSGAGESGARFYLPDTFTWDNYRRVLTDRYFHAVAYSTLQLCALTAAICSLLAYPLAVWIDRAGRPMGALGAWVVALPKLTNALVLLYGVLLFLGNAGLLNRVLLAVGAIRTPLPMFANLFAVMVGEVLLVLPYPVLMLVGVLRATGRDLEEAARGLGASPVRAFCETTFRLTLPGATLALLVTLVWGAGAFVAPLVLGNPALYTVSVEIHTQTFERVNWPLAATLAVLQLAGVLALAALALVAQRLVPQVSAGRPHPADFKAHNTGSPARGATLEGSRHAGPGHASSFTTGWGKRPGAHAVSRETWDLRLGALLARLGFHGYALATLLFLLGPLLFSVLVSLTPTQTISLPSPVTGLSVRWYVALLGDPLWRAALWHSLLTAAVATAIAVPSGTLAALALDRLPGNGGRLLTLLLIAPLFAPGVVLGLQALAAFHRLGIWGQPYSVGLAHAMWTMPLAFLVVRASLSAVDRLREEAAQGLGAHPAVAFCLVSLPRLWPSLGAATFLCATMSINELPMALFLATPATRTLPTLIWPQLRYNLSPVVAAASSVLLLITLCGLLVTTFLLSARFRAGTTRRQWT